MGLDGSVLPSHKPKSNPIGSRGRRLTTPSHTGTLLWSYCLLSDKPQLDVLSTTRSYLEDNVMCLNTFLASASLRTEVSEKSSCRRFATFLYPHKLFSTFCSSEPVSSNHSEFRFPQLPQSA